MNEQKHNFTIGDLWQFVTNQTTSFPQAEEFFTNTRDYFGLYKFTSKQQGDLYLFLNEYQYKYNIEKKIYFVFIATSVSWDGKSFGVYTIGNDGIKPVKMDIIEALVMVSREKIRVD